MRKFRLHDVQTWEIKAEIAKHLNEPPRTSNIREATYPVGPVDLMLLVSEAVFQRCSYKKTS